jgi:hypothetical protein
MFGNVPVDLAAMICRTGEGHGDAQPQRHQDRQPQVSVLAVHDGSGEHCGDRGHVAHRQVQPAASGSDHAHLTEAEQGDKGRQLDGQEDLPDAQEAGQEDLADHEQQNDQQERDDQTLLPVVELVEGARTDPRHVSLPSWPAWRLDREYS